MPACLSSTFNRMLSTARLVVQMPALINALMSTCRTCKAISHKPRVIQLASLCIASICMQEHMLAPSKCRRADNSEVEPQVYGCGYPIWPQGPWEWSASTYVNGFQIFRAAQYRALGQLITATLQLTNIMKAVLSHLTCC